MAKKILLLLLFIIAVSSARVAVVQPRAANLPFAEKMVVRLNEFTEAKRYGIDNKDGLSQIIASENTQILVMLSTSIAVNYARLIREGKTLPPHITILDAPIREEDVITLKRNGVVVIAQTSPVFFEGDEAFIERMGALIVLATMQDVNSGNNPRFSYPIRIRLPSAALQQKNAPDSRQLAQTNALILAQIDRISPQIKRQIQSGEDLWRLYVSSLGAIIDTTPLTGKNPMIISNLSETIDKINKFVATREFGYTALIIIIIMSFVLSCKILVKSYHRKLYKRRNALLMPASLNNTPLVGDDGKRVPLKILLENEGYRTILASAKNFEQTLQNNFPDALIADWEAVPEMIEIFHQEFIGSQNSKKINIVLINIPITKQTLTKKMFGGANVFCYESVPTLNDMQAHLRGTKQFSSYSEGSYMSGIIDEDNLTAILQMIEGNMYTGCLIVEEDTPVSSIYFKGGRVVYAGESGMKAIYAALNCRRGNFYFHLNKTADTENLNLGTIEILMGWAEQRDRFTKKIKAIGSD